MAMITSTKSDVLRSILTAQPYKPGQGKMARNGTLIAIGILIVSGMYSWGQIQVGADSFTKWGIPVIFGCVAGWVTYRMVHYPRFADFLISTEAEMAKVTWPSREELRASTIVVLVNVLLFAVFLFATDSFWKFILQLMGILKIGGLLGSGGSGM